MLITVTTLSALAADDHIEVGAFNTRSGVRASCVYDLPEHVVFIILPDGRRIQVDLRAGNFHANLRRILASDS
jgi:hypothetical protein